MFYEYKAYVTSGYRVLIHVVVPVLLIALLGFLSLITGLDLSVYIASCIGATLIGADYFGVGPICRKDSAVCTIIRSSSEGKKFIKSMLLQDMTIRLIVYAASAVVAEAIAILNKNYSLLVPIAFCASIMLTTLTLNISRHIESIQGAMLTAILSTGIYVLAFMGLDKILASATSIVVPVVILAVFVIAAVLASIFSVKYQMKRSELCYHD